MVALFTWELYQLNAGYVTQIEHAKTTKDLLSIWKKMQKEAFPGYPVRPEKFGREKFEKLDILHQKKALLDCLDMNHLYLNYSDMEDSTFKVSAKDKEHSRAFYANH